MCTTMCTQSTCVSPARYKHQHVLGVLHQSDGGKSSADQLQQTESTLVWSEPHQGPNKFVKERGKDLRFERGCDFSLRGRKRRRKGVLDSSPEIDRPGGHSEEKDPNQSRGD